MEKNVGTIDRIIRTVIVAFIAVLYFKGIITGWLALTLIILGCIFLISSIAAVCPLYILLGIRTCNKQKLENTETA